MFYRAFRAISSLALRLFFQIETPVDPHRALQTQGPVVFVGNHPNGLIDPGMLFILARRQVTFLAKEPLFRIPVLGWILKGMDALPVFRKQDGPGDTTKNESTLTASVDALVAGRAITLFPEGKSHSEPQLAELKTGAARIALEAVRRGAPVTLVPVGITYEEKDTFRSRVHVEVGLPLQLTRFLEQGEQTPQDAARALTDAIADALRAVTLNLEAWEELPILETAEQLYALEHGEKAGDSERRKAFARGMAVLRTERPEQFEALKSQLKSFRSRMDLLRVSPDDLSSQYRPLTVAWFIVRNLLWLTSLPLFALGMLLFVIPYYLPLVAVKATKPDVDVESTIKFVVALVLGPLWWALLTGLAWWQGGVGFGVFTLIAVPFLALFTRIFYERRLASLRDVRTFFTISSRKQLKVALVAEGAALTRQINALAEQLRPRVG